MKKDPELAKWIIEDLRDETINTYLEVETGWVGASAPKALHEKMKDMSDEARIAARQAVARAIDAAIHSFLYRLQELHENGVEIGLYENGKNIASLSDGLPEELSGSDGWIATYSQHKDGLDKLT